MGCFGKPETDEEKAQKERSKRIEKTIREDKQKYKATHRLLLLGNTLLTNRWPNIWTSFILKIIILWQPNIKHIYLHTAYAFSSSSELSCDSLVIDVIKWLICCSSCQPSNSSHSLPLRSDELDDSDWAPYSQVMCVKSSLLGLSICTLQNLGRGPNLHRADKPYHMFGKGRVTFILVVLKQVLHHISVLDSISQCI